MNPRTGLALLVLTVGCNDGGLVRGESDDTPTSLPPERQPRIYLVWDESERMRDFVPGLDLDGDGVSAPLYDVEDDWQHVFTCGDDNDVPHPAYATTWNSWDHAANTRYDLVLAGLLPFLDSGSLEPAANGDLFRATILDPATAPVSCTVRVPNGKDDNHDSDRIDLAMIALGASWGPDHTRGTADDAACRFKEETTDLRRGGGPVRSFFNAAGLPPDTTSVPLMTHNDWVSDHALYGDLGGSAQLAKALAALSAPADGVLDADGIASLADVRARDANSCRPYAVVVISAGVDVSGCAGPDPRGAALDAASRLASDGVPVYTITTADSPPQGIDLLAEVGAAGGTAPYVAATPADVTASLDSIRDALVARVADCP